MSARNINFTSRQFAKLAGYKLVFNKKAKDGDFAYANIMPSDKDIVEGVLYEFPDTEIVTIDRAEGFPRHYDKVEIVVTDKKGNSIEATTYVAQADKIVNELLPLRKYLKHLLAGKDVLTPAYFEKLSKTETL